MACVNPDGSLTLSARKLLRMLAEPMSPEEAAEKLQLPLFKIRSSLREMTRAGMVVQTGEDKYRTSEEGLRKIAIYS
ncbi:MAG: hypothetical protein ACOYVF_01970 [Candidatus Zixiibacteriota bacterium]